MNKRVNTFLVALLVATIAVLPAMIGSFGTALMNDIGVSTWGVLGLVMLTGTGGATSFGQAAFVGIAAYATGWLTTTQDLSPWLGLLFALFLTGAAALAIGMLTLHLGGHYLPLSTIAWGLSIPLLFGNIAALGSNTGLANIPPLQIGPWSLMEAKTIYYLIWPVVGLAFLFSYNLMNSRAGRAIRSLRGGATLLGSVGADAYRVRLWLFVTAAQLAAIAGWLYAHMNRFVSPSAFNLRASIEYLLMAIAGGVGHLAGALFGSGVVLLLKNKVQDALQILSSNGARLEIIVFGIVFILLLHFARGGAMGLIARWSARRKTPSAPALADDGTPPLPRRPLPTRGSEILRVEHALKRFGGLVAVNDVSFTVNVGEIVGLIGPNGAGKSTLFNLVTGAAPVSGGTIAFCGRDITHLPQRRIARLGMARTFQHVNLRPNMSVLDSVALGAHARGSAGMLRGGLSLDRREEHQIMAEAWRQLARVGLAERAGERAGSLPLGWQRILEIARALAADPILLVLDEPAAGLRKQEKAALAELLRGLRSEGITILIVEHDMDFVMKLVDRLVVMNFGSMLLQDSPAVVRADPRVQSAYLGSVL